MHPSAEASNVWSKTRENASKKMSKLQDINFARWNTAFDFLDFLDALRSGRDNSESYRSLCNSANQAVRRASIAQEAMLDFREDIRFAIGRITTLLSDGGRDISLFITESSQSLLELATGVEECNAILEEHCLEFKEMLQQSSDETSNRPSEEEFRMVQEKWQAFKEISGPNAYRWQALKLEMQEPKGRGKPASRSNNSTRSTMLAVLPLKRNINVQTYQISG
ncbi:hypothetical protein AGABI2DRAFT_179485 [Agaricus bisporus var. bisporus H97]|uniref:hypothetical protein n=1 Tax=Agaricus bisporus var. bisporus (strain H97 / ATCC MYA-4626 / FGSC 10389) TaxID=936046 RepID=UPI00029F7FDB|nr:hypothetical protein AGABI2DRAFT_179485 [Agaricus bisporus var. bisporus H97]EKV46076.1 hypothetical protein AGABI2DRAFT_179485 [Agaricus bisporus var. bisporus H97]